MRRRWPTLSLVSLGAAFALLFSALPVRAGTYPLGPDQTAIGSLSHYRTRKEDTLLDVARHFDLGYTELITANRKLDPWLPGVGKRVVIPALFLLPDTPRKGIVVNLTRQRLFYYPPDGETVETYPIGVGVEGRTTPLGVTRIVSKQTHPAWYPPASIRAERPDLPTVVPAGPDNPMGDYALYLGWPSYGIHGTNKPYGVGRNVSHGCIRLYPEDIEYLFQEVPVGTEVRVIDQEAQVAWISNNLFLAVFPNKKQTDELDIGHPFEPVASDAVLEQVMTAAEGNFGRVDWNVVNQVARERTGIPTRVTRDAAADVGDAQSELMSDPAKFRVQLRPSNPVAQ